MAEILFEHSVVLFLCLIALAKLDEYRIYLERQRWLESPEHKENQRNVIRYIQFKKKVGELEKREWEYE